MLHPSAFQYIANSIIAPDPYSTPREPARRRRLGRRPAGAYVR